jgi:hypothetical protein
MSSIALLDMLSARAVADNNTALTDMLARMRNGSEAGSQPNMQEVIAQMAQDNPVLGLLAQQMAERRSVVAEVAPVEVETDGIEMDAGTHETEDGAQNVFATAYASANAEVVQLRERLQWAQNEVSALRDREDILAEALGACCLCWGEDNQCRACRGRGRPGFAMPDEEAFGELVLPAVRMFRACRTKRGVIAPMTSIMNSAPGASSGALRHT